MPTKLTLRNVALLCVVLRRIAMGSMRHGSCTWSFKARRRICVVHIGLSITAHWRLRSRALSLWRMGNRTRDGALGNTSLTLTLCLWELLHDIWLSLRPVHPRRFVSPRDSDGRLDKRKECVTYDAILSLLVLLFLLLCISETPSDTRKKG
jgi:hypothetical protein